MVTNLVSKIPVNDAENAAAVRSLMTTHLQYYHARTITKTNFDYA